jgi:hypothetical protein
MRTISLDTIVGYRQKLLSSGTVNGVPFFWVVVGRQDTASSKAQVRGSRHAWDIRLISAKALIKLVKMKENSDELETGEVSTIVWPTHACWALWRERYSPRKQLAPLRSSA